MSAYRRNPCVPEPEEYFAEAASLERAIAAYDAAAASAPTPERRRYHEEKAGECRAAADQALAKAREGVE